MFTNIITEIWGFSQKKSQKFTNESINHKEHLLQVNLATHYNLYSLLKSFKRPKRILIQYRKGKLSHQLQKSQVNMKINKKNLTSLVEKKTQENNQLLEMFAPPSSIIYHFIIIIFTCTFKWATVRVALIKKRVVAE